MSFRRAFLAEMHRLLRNRNLLFWGFLFVPTAYVIFTLALDLVLWKAPAGVGGGVDPLREGARSLSVGGNPLAHLFFAIGAAGIFGGEYRFATWRLMCPRLPRGTMVAAKWTAYVVLTFCNLALVCFGSFIEPAVIGILLGEPLRQSQVTAATLAILFAASFMELAAFGSLVAVATVVTRSVMGAVVPAFLFSLIQASSAAYLQPPAAISPLLALPVFAGDTVRRYAIGVDGLPGVSAPAAAASLAILAAWAIGALMAALALFDRQDLSRE